MMEGLPVLRIALVFPLMLFNSMTVSTVYTFLPKLVKEFGSSEVDAGFSVGLIASSLFTSRTFFYIFWGNVSDKIGRKIPLAITSYGLAFSTMAFGFSRSFHYALVIRFIQGCFMVLNILCKSILADVCDETNYTYSLSILVSANSLGRVIGPSMGGLLSFPVQQYPNIFPKGGFFETYPIFLPMIILSSSLMLATSIMVKFLPGDAQNKTMIYTRINIVEPIDIKKNDTIVFLPGKDDEGKTEQVPIKDDDTNYSTKVRHDNLNDSMSCSLYSKIRESKFFRALETKEVLISCFLYFCYAFISVGTSEMYPLFASTSKELNGFGFSPAKVGLTLLLVSIFLILFQSFLQAKISNFLGAIRLVTFSLLGYAFVYPLLPSLVTIDNDHAQTFILCLWLFVVRAHTTIANLGVNIFIRNSVGSDLTGSAMGLAQAANSCGSMLCPLLFGRIYTWSLQNVKDGVLGFPLNQYFVFLIQSLWGVLIVLLTSFIPKTLEKKKMIEV